MTRQRWNVVLPLLSVLLISPWAIANSNVTVRVDNINGEPLADMVVYLEPLNTAQSLPVNPSAIQISQKDKAFAPYVNVMQKGGQASFINEDDITHHIYSPISKNKFSFKIKTHEQKRIESFDHTGEVAMGCNIHDWMSGYILVVDTPYFAKSDTQGLVKISHVIAGDYLLNVWHPQLQSKDNKQVQRVEIKNDVEVSVKLKSTLKPMPVQKSDDDFDFLSDY